MKLHSKLLTALAITGMLGMAACVETETPPEATEVAEQTSSVALKIEQAERLLERGGDAKEAKRLLREALDDDTITDDERHGAIISLSSALEALDDTDGALAMLGRRSVPELALPRPGP